MGTHIPFEDHMKFAQTGESPAAWRHALISVGDTCNIGQSWFLDRGIKPTAADLLKWTELVLAHERRLDRGRMPVIE